VQLVTERAACVTDSGAPLIMDKGLAQLAAYSHRRALRRQRIGVRLSFLAEYIQTIVILVRRIRCNGDETQKVSLSFLMPSLLNARL
jgi:hypothetical protein